LTAKEAEVEILYISHHDPDRSDAEVFQILSESRKIFPGAEIATESTVCEFPDCQSTNG
jgi:ribonuclease BN (tRNA processing enzyme)